MIQINHLNKDFGTKSVLRDISTTFNAGVTNLIIGQSGSGKTVLMKCIRSEERRVGKECRL